MKTFNYLKQITVMTATALALVSHASADIGVPFPANPADLQGAFSGKQYINGKKRSVEVLIHGVSMSGSFIITLLRASRSSTKAQIYYAEILERQAFGLMILGLNEGKDWTRVNPPAALMKILVENNKIKSIEISPQDGVDFLEGPVSLTNKSRKYRISDVLAQGEYVGDSRSDILKVYQSTASDVLVSGSVPDLNLSNDYSLSFDLTGVGALRSRSYVDYFQQEEKTEVSALMLPISVGRDAGVIVIKPNHRNGNAIDGRAMIMELK